MEHSIGETVGFYVDGHKHEGTIVHKHTQDNKILFDISCDDYNVLNVPTKNIM